MSVLAILAAAAVSLPGTAATAASGPTFDAVGWSADGGVPVELADGAVLYLFGDTVKPGSFEHNSAVIQWEGVTIPLWSPGGLLRAGVGSWFWPADALQNDDGSVTVIASEVRRDPSSWFGFEGFDTDVFVVRDPYSVQSWRLAEHIDSGPWDGLNVSFLDATRAVVRPYGSSTTFLADLTTVSWDREPLFAGDSDGTFVMVEHEGSRFGLTWDMATGHVALWGDSGSGWVLRDEWDAEPLSYGHQLHSVNGRIVYVYSPPGNGYELGQSRAFPQFLDITEALG